MNLKAQIHFGNAYPVDIKNIKRLSIIWKFLVHVEKLRSHEFESLRNASFNKFSKDIAVLLQRIS